jgi:hypothetical protein
MSLNLDKYHTFATQLEQLRDYIAANHLNVQEIREHLTLLEQFFRSQIVPLNNDQSIEHTEQMYITEMSKQLRLLSVDIMFLGGARQAETISSRLKTICDRLTTLCSYCERIRGVGSSE